MKNFLLMLLICPLLAFAQADKPINNLYTITFNNATNHIITFKPKTTSKNKVSYEPNKEVLLKQAGNSFSLAPKEHKNIQIIAPTDSNMTKSWSLIDTRTHNTSNIYIADIYDNHKTLTSKLNPEMTVSADKNLDFTMNQTRVLCNSSTEEQCEYNSSVKVELIIEGM